MIQLCNRAVLTLQDDGSTDFFQTDILQDRLESSCRAAGLNDTWIAEDIALSVEYSLGELGNDKVFTDTEIDSIVVKILQEAGLGAVATHYQLQPSNQEKHLSFKPSAISEIAARYLHLEGEKLEFVVRKVSDAGRKLFLEESSPTLILELAKHYMNDKTFPLANSSSLPKELHSCPWLISREDMINKVSPKTAELIAAEVIGISGISRLFPSLRIEIKFADFTKLLGFTPPVSELVFISSLTTLAEGIDDLAESAGKRGLELPEKLSHLPVYLKFTDAPEFTEIWLGGNWNDNRSCFEELVAELKTHLTHKVFSYS